MLTWILGSLAGAAILYFLSRLFSKKKRAEKKTQIQKQLDEKRKFHHELIETLRKILKKEDASSDELDQRLPEKFDPILDLWKQVQKVVSEIRFFEQKVSVQQKVGEEVRPSNIPTGDVEIAKLQKLHQLPSALSSSIGQEDDIFYAQIANNDIFIKQPIERVGIYEEKFYKKRKKLRVLVDVSGSTKGDRNAWSKLICDLLLARAKKIRAEIVITIFTSTPGKYSMASPEKAYSYEEMKRFIDENIRADGGTDINLALNHELQEIERENADSMEKIDAQIVLITDGTEGIDEDLVLQKVKQENVTLHTVILGVQHEQLRRVSNRFNFLDVPAIE